MVEVFWIKSTKTEYRGGITIRLVVKRVDNLVLTLWCIDLKMMWWWVLSDGGKHLSLWKLCWRFLWRGSRV